MPHIVLAFLGWEERDYEPANSRTSDLFNSGREPGGL